MSALKPAEKLLLTFGMYCARSWSFDNLELFGDQQGSSADVATTDIGHNISLGAMISQCDDCPLDYWKDNEDSLPSENYIHLNDKHRQ